MLSDTMPQTRREWLTMIGKVGGGVAMYQAMTALGHAAETQFDGPPNLSGAPKGSTVLILGAGLAGMLAAHELSKAGYRVQILEYQGRPGGRNYSVRGGDKIVEVGGATQEVSFRPGNYLNPGPWRIPHHHRTLLHYCKAFGVELQPFIQLNHNGFIHRKDAFGGKPQRYREVAVDFKGHVSELLSKALNAGSLDDKISSEDKEKLLVAMREWGLLDGNLNYTGSIRVSAQRGYDLPPGGGVGGAPTASGINSLNDVLSSRIWGQMGFYFNYTMQTTMFQPVGGMDMVGKGFARQVGKFIRYNSKVVKLAQDETGVTASWEDTKTGQKGETRAAWCVCTIPASILGQMDIQVSDAKKAAIKALPYSSSAKIGLEMKSRFWEEKYSIYGGHSFSDHPSIGNLSYPNFDFFRDAPGILTSLSGGPGGFALAGMTHEQRIEAALEQGSIFHPEEMRREFITGASFAWSRQPWILGCCATWTAETRKQHYQNLISLDGRIVLAGEHASYVGCWMEGALLSSLDAITRLHQRALAA